MLYKNIRITRSTVIAHSVLSNNSRGVGLLGVFREFRVGRLVATKIGYTHTYTYMYVRVRYFL